MATLDDVEIGLCQALASLVFPGTAYQFGEVGTCSASYTGAPGAVLLSIPAKLYVGDPNTTILDKDLTAGIAHITVHRNVGFSRDTTRFSMHRKKTSRNVPSLQAAMGVDRVTFGGTCAAGLVVGITVSKTCYAYLVTAQDEVSSVVTALAAAIPGATASGAVLAVAGVTSATVAIRQTGIFVTGQQEQLLSIKIYAPPIKGPVAASGYLVRSALGSLVNRLKSIQRPDGSITRFIGLPDGSKARVFFHDEINNDRVDRANMWIRVLGFYVEYDETITENPMTVIAPLIVGNVNGTRIMWLGNGAPTANILTDGQGRFISDSSGAPLGSLA